MSFPWNRARAVDVCYEACYEARPLSNGQWEVVDPECPYIKYYHDTLKRLVDNIRLNWCGPSCLVVKTRSPDFRDWELVWDTAYDMYFTEDELFRMQLDVSTEDFYK